MKILQLICIVSIAFSIFGIVSSIYGASYKYNMTKQMEEETRLLDICIYTDIKIPNCHDIYGGLNKTYGDNAKH